jgi:Flp pilus assembly protein TadG
MMHFIKRFYHADSGAPAIEFALIAPVMIGMFLGIAGVANTIVAARKVGSIASTAADLVAQTTAIDDAQMADVMGALSVVLRPFNAADAQIRITSVVADDDGQTSVDWSDAQNWSPRQQGSLITVPNEIVPANQGIIMAEVNFNFNGIVLSDTFYLKPRRSTTVIRE